MVDKAQKRKKSALVRSVGGAKQSWYAVCLCLCLYHILSPQCFPAQWSNAAASCRNNTGVPGVSRIDAAASTACLPACFAETKHGIIHHEGSFRGSQIASPHTGFIPCHCIRCVCVCVCVSPRVSHDFTHCVGCSSIINRAYRPRARVTNICSARFSYAQPQSQSQSQSQSSSTIICFHHIPHTTHEDPHRWLCTVDMSGTGVSGTIVVPVQVFLVLVSLFQIPTANANATATATTLFHLN